MIHEMSNGERLVQDGSLRAEKMAKEDNNDAFEAFWTIFFAILPGLTQLLKTKDFKRF